MDPNDLRINRSSLKLARVGKEGVPQVVFSSGYERAVCLLLWLLPSMCLMGRSEEINALLH